MKTHKTPALLACIALLTFLVGCASPNTATKDTPTSAPTTSAVDPTGDPTIGDAPFTEDPTPESTDIPTGTKGDSFTISSVDDSSSGEITLLDVFNVRPGEYDDPAENGRYVEVLLSAKATSGTFSINPFDFALVDAEGSEYDSTYVDGAKGSDLNSRDLHTGQKAKGYIVYDAPKGALTLAYRGGGFGDEDVATWTLGK